MNRMSTRYIGELVDALANAFPSVSAFRRLLSEQLGWSLAKMAREGNLDDMIAEVVQTAIARGEDRELLEHARAVNPGNQKLVAVEKLLPSASTVTVIDAFETCYFRRHVFIDRSELRRSIKRLAAPDGPRVLVIDGPPGSGKSHSVFYIHHVAERRRFAVVDIDFRTKYAGQTITAHLVATDIAMQMGLTPPPQADDEPVARRIQMFCNTLTAKLRDMHGIWWIVFDGCCDTLAMEVLDLIHELAHRVDRAWYNVRVVIVSDASELPLPLSVPIERESIPAIDDLLVAEFVMQFRMQHGLPHDDAEVEGMFTAIMKRVDRSSPRWMQMLSEAAAEQCRLALEE